MKISFCKGESQIEDENKFLGMVFAPKRKEMSDDRRKLHNEELHVLDFRFAQQWPFETPVFWSAMPCHSLAVQTFWRNLLHPSSGLKSSPHEAGSKQICACLVLLL
jgi:hypothetical protein